MKKEQYDYRFRHENKYLLTPWQETVLRLEVSAVLTPDKHALKNGGAYSIHSLYFDDVNDSCLKDNLCGTDPRSKFRIRYYNRNTDYIVLEKKTKRQGMGVKTACTLTRAECEQLMRGCFPMITPDMPPTKQTLLTEMCVRDMKPRILVDYQRIPFVYPGGNVRITFDRNLAASAEIPRFLTGDYHLQPVMADGQSILEVKWDELLPRNIKDMVQPETLTWTAFSKYTICRSASL